jgi:tRNA-splicing ligase RtcB
MKQVIHEEGSRPIKIWTNDVEDEALTQLKNLSRLPFIAANGVACMPDVHAGKGSTVGTVIATDKAIIPAAVGVDIGCVDDQTEYLSPTGWRKIIDYDGGLVMQYHSDTGYSDFVQPTNFIRKPATEFFKIKSKYGVNQMISPDHRVLYRATSRIKGDGELTVATAEEIFDKHDANVQGFSGKFLTTFYPIVQHSIAITDMELRVMIMVCADGAFDARKPESRRCVLQFIKKRKFHRAEELLKAASIAWRRDDIDDERGHVYRLIFDAPLRQKSLSEFWGADLTRLRLIADEVPFWDGDVKSNVYRTRDKPSADFVQYAFSASGYRATLLVDKRDDGEHYRVFGNKNIEVGIKSSPKTAIERIDATGREQFCFTVPSSFWIMRRGSNVVITGNCGMNAVRLSLKASDLPDSLLAIRNQIERDVPTGSAGHSKVNGALPKHLWNSSIYSAIGMDAKRFSEKSINQLGTLGSGNHFIELCIDENQDVWIMLHSGSRGIGNMIGSYFIEKAKRRMEQYFIHLPDGDLAYLPEDTDDFNEYIEAVNWAQNYALENRRVMMEAVIAALRRHIPVEFTITQEAINCHHNYVEKENHFGRNLWVTRKGAIRARAGDLGIIPGSMGQKSYIVRGKGNLESYCSCSHGAGRKMSRTKARATFTVEDLKAQTKGIECRKDDAVLDEIPASYKNIDEVMANQTDLVDVVHILKQVLCVKGG